MLNFHCRAWVQHSLNDQCDRALTVTAPRMWNKLPHICTVNDLDLLSPNGGPTSLIDFYSWHRLLYFNLDVQFYSILSLLKAFNTLQLCCTFLRISMYCFMGLYDTACIYGNHCDNCEITVPCDHTRQRRGIDKKKNHVENGVNKARLPLL